MKTMSNSETCTASEIKLWMPKKNGGPAMYRNRKPRKAPQSL